MVAELILSRRQIDWLAIRANAPPYHILFHYRVARGTFSKFEKVSGRVSLGYTERKENKHYGILVLINMSILWIGFELQRRGWSSPHEGVVHALRQTKPSIVPGSIKVGPASVGALLEILPHKCRCAPGSRMWRIIDWLAAVVAHL